MEAGQATADQSSKPSRSFKHTERIASTDIDSDGWGKSLIACGHYNSVKSNRTKCPNLPWRSMPNSITDEFHIRAGANTNSINPTH
jgi:hypothetical protein